MIYIGIDISKLTFDVAVLNNGQIKNRQFDNNPKGFKSFHKVIKPFSYQVICCMEATGIYGLSLAKALFNSKHKIIVANPIKTHAFAQMEMLRNKTDQADAGSIARFCKHIDDQGQLEKNLYTPKGECYERMQFLFTRLQQLKKQHNQETNRLGVSVDKIATRSIKAMIKFIAKQMVKIETQIQTCVDQDDGLKQQVDLLTSIKGIGQNTAWAILAYLGDVALFKNSRQVTSFAGLCPRLEQSGTSVNKSRLSKMGHRGLRKALYMPAVVASHHNQITMKLYQRLVDSGKPKKLAIIAVMRKLLVLSFGVLKSQTRFDPNYQTK